MTNRRRGWLIAMGIAGILGVAVWVFNAFAYPIDMGYDACGNWDCIALLIRSWTLSAPETGWSTAHPSFFYYFAATISRAFGAVLSEEILVTGLISIVAVGVAADSPSSPASRRALIHATVFGAVAGLALLTKLTGLLIIGVGSRLISWTACGLERRFRRFAALSSSSRLRSRSVDGTTLGVGSATATSTLTVWRFTGSCS